jgi:hypothetical protein
MPRSTIALDDLLALCERFYERDGFVKWAEVGAAVGVSRQAIHARLTSAVRAGHLSPEAYDRLQSVTARTASSRGRRAERHLQDLRCALTPENATWLRHEAALRKVRRADIVNGLLTRQRLALTSDP